MLGYKVLSAAAIKALITAVGGDEEKSATLLTVFIAKEVGKDATALGDTLSAMREILEETKAAMDGTAVSRFNPEATSTARHPEFD